jgi:pimeloyl-ACP methyl ester carboxylesterase
MEDNAPNSAKRGRSAELRPDRSGRLTARWQLTDSRVTDPVQITVPPTDAIPVVFVPGIMGSNLCSSDGIPIWVLDSTAGAPAGLAFDWTLQGPGARQKLLHPERTKVFGGGHVPPSSATGLTEDDFTQRGWGEVSEASYHRFLLWLDYKLNSERNPALWGDFEASPSAALPAQEMARLPPGRLMRMTGMPETAEGGKSVDPVTSDELLKRAKFRFPIYAYGYNWLDTNTIAARGLKTRIDSIIAENNGPHSRCVQVIVVTHSMGGLVARACAQLPGMASKILGVVHGVMPATGAAVAYRRCKVGMKDEDYAASLVIGADGQRVTAVFAQSPGALQLLPSEGYGANWLSICDATGRELLSLPKADPYEEIYLQKEKWWGLIREDWLRPTGGKAITWNVFAKNIRTAREFHRQLAGSYHPNTFVFYGGGKKKQSFHKIRWQLKRGQSSFESKPQPSEVPDLGHKDVETDGSNNNIYVEGINRIKTVGTNGATGSFTMATRVWEIHCAMHDSTGDGTVPASSGRAPAASGTSHIIQQFELADIEHEPAYKKYPHAQQVAYYAITKLAALAKI